jgi:hypothetical protein
MKNVVSKKYIIEGEGLMDVKNILNRIISSGLMYRFFLVIGVLCLLGLLFYPWGFMRDDYGFLAHAAAYAKSWGEFFKPHNVVDFVYPSNQVTGQFSWTGSFYRPIQFVHFAIEYLIFGANAYGYLLFILLMHATTGVVLFNMGRKYFPQGQAFFAAGMILLHPMIMLWIGVFTIQIYMIDGLYFMGVTWLLKQFCDTRRWLFYLASCSVFFVAILAKETLIVYCGWAFIALLWYQSWQKPTIPWVMRLKYAVSVAAGYFGVGVGYLALRYFVFDGAVGPVRRIFGFASWHEFYVRQSERFYDLVTYVCNYLYVGALPGGNRLLKLVLTLLVAGILVFPFYRRKRLGLLVFLSFSILSITWPAWFLYYHTRYAYAGLIFLYFIILFAINFYMDRCSVLRRSGPILGVFVLAGFGLYGVQLQCIKNRVLSTVTSAACDLAQSLQGTSGRLLLVGLPHYWFASGAGQLEKLFFPATKRVTMVIGELMVWGDREYGLLLQHTVLVSRHGNVIDFRIPCDQQVSFFPTPSLVGQQNESDDYLLTIHEVNKNGWPIHITIELKDAFLRQDPTIVSWDYERHKFLRL